MSQPSESRSLFCVEPATYRIPSVPRHRFYLKTGRSASGSGPRRPQTRSSFRQGTAFLFLQQAHSFVNVCVDTGSRNPHVWRICTSMQSERERRSRPIMGTSKDVKLFFFGFFSWFGKQVLKSTHDHCHPILKRIADFRFDSPCSSRFFNHIQSGNASRSDQPLPEYLELCIIRAWCIRSQIDIEPGNLIEDLFASDSEISDDRLNAPQIFLSYPVVAVHTHFTRNKSCFSAVYIPDEVFSAIKQRSVETRWLLVRRTAHQR